MATFDTVKSKMESLILKANRTTGKRNADLTEAISTLADGYGKMAGEIITTYAMAQKCEIRRITIQEPMTITTNVTVG